MDPIRSAEHHSIFAALAGSWLSGLAAFDVCVGIASSSALFVHPPRRTGSSPEQCVREIDTF